MGYFARLDYENKELLAIAQCQLVRYLISTRKSNLLGV